MSRDREGQQYLSNEGEVENAHEEVVDVPDCKGILRHLWNTRVVTLQNEADMTLAEGIYHNVNLNVVARANGPLGDHCIAMQISKPLYAADVPNDWRYSLRASPIHLVFLNGASLRDHGLRDDYNRKQASLLQPSYSNTRPSTSAVRNPPRQSCVKLQTLLTKASIKSVWSQTYCADNCHQPFLREKIRVFREQMYQNTTFELRYHMKLDIHRQVHHNAQGKRVTKDTIECVLKFPLPHIDVIQESLVSYSSK